MKIRRRSGQKGVAVVEAALTLIMFFTVLLGIIEAGRFISVYQTLTDAAREGARLGVAPYSGTSNRPSDAEIEAEVQRFLDSNAIQGATITVQRDHAPGATANEFTRVTASLTYEVITASWFANIEVPIAGTAMMRNETAN
jgi:Flp pilus assembly protein TadG